MLASNLCDVATVLYQLSYHANPELVTKRPGLLFTGMFVDKVNVKAFCSLNYFFLPVCNLVKSPVIQKNSARRLCATSSDSRSDVPTEGRKDGNGRVTISFDLLPADFVLCLWSSAIDGHFFTIHVMRFVARN